MLRSSDIPRLLAIAGIAVLAACSDATAPATPKLTRPSLAAPQAPASIQRDVIINALQRTEDSLIVELTVTPTGGWFVAGVNAVYFPPNSICEPSTSGYGRTLWDAPCEPATGPVTIHGRAGLRGAQIGWIQFDEDLRFVPSEDPDRWVRIYMYSDEVREEQPVDFLERELAYGIVWVPTPGAAPIDEAVADSSLRTQVLWGSGLVTRRVKQIGRAHV